MGFGINPPTFEEKDYVKENWFRSIFKWFEETSKTVSVSTAYTVAADVQWVRVDASGGAVTVTLPDCASNWRREIGVIKTDNSSNAVTISRAGSDTINGATSKSLNGQYARIRVKSAGTTAWDVTDHLTASSAYTITNATTDRTYDADATTTAELADVLATVIQDLKDRGILG